VGRDGKLFYFHKFRTMYVDARERFPELYAYDHDDDELETLFFKLKDDPRLTRVGARLRRTSLDELPNFLNVLTGEMSLVGPRPEIPEMIRCYQPEELLKFATKPGVTGLAQISGRNILRFKETNACDLEYVERRSLRFDLEILYRTPGVVVRMIGAL
jgi:lipopolysaccharide/colanic/teichoic acid biosynthesis glycosyltransferase